MVFDLTILSLFVILRLDKERDVRTDSADSLSGKEVATVRLVAAAYDVSLSSFFILWSNKE